MVCSHGFWNLVDHVRLINGDWSRIYQHTTKRKRKKKRWWFSYLKVLTYTLLFHSQSKNIQLAPSHTHIQQQQQKATGHITSLLTDSDAPFGCEMPTTLSDKKEIMFLITSFSSLFFLVLKKKIFHVQQSMLICYTHSKNGIAALKHSNTGRGPSEETCSSDPSWLPSRR